MEELETKIYHSDTQDWQNNFGQIEGDGKKCLGGQRKENCNTQDEK